MIQTTIHPHRRDLTTTHQDSAILQINLENLTRISIELTNLNSIPEIRLNTHDQWSPPGAALLMKSTND